MDLLLMADQKVEPGWILGPEGLQKPRKPCPWTMEDTEGRMIHCFFRSKEIREMVEVNPDLSRAPWIDKIPYLNRDQFLLLLLYRETEVLRAVSSQDDACIQKLSVGPAAHLLFLPFMYQPSHVFDELESRLKEIIKTDGRKMMDGRDYQFFGKFCKITCFGESVESGLSSLGAYQAILEYVSGNDSAHVPILAHISLPSSAPETHKVVDTDPQQRSSKRKGVCDCSEEGPVTRSRAKKGQEVTESHWESPYQSAPTPRITVKETPRAIDIPGIVDLNSPQISEHTLQGRTSRTGNTNTGKLNLQATVSAESSCSYTYKDCRELLKKSFDTDSVNQSSNSFESPSSGTILPQAGTNSAISHTERSVLSIRTDTRYSNTPSPCPGAPQRHSSVVSYADANRCRLGAASRTDVTTVPSNSSTTISSTISAKPPRTTASAACTRTTTTDRNSQVGMPATSAENNNRAFTSSSGERAVTSFQGTRTSTSSRGTRATNQDIGITKSASGVKVMTSASVINTHTSASLKPELLRTLTPTSSWNAREDECGIRRKTFGTISSSIKNKTLLLLGAKGSGKTCLVNAVANFIFGVKSNSEKKWTVSDETVKTGFSSTDNITGYTFVFKDQDEDVSLTLIDTPGLNDSSGNEVRDHVDSLKTFLANAAHKGLEIHCVAFVVQAHLVRLTSSERLVMDHLKTLFGQDVSDHVINLITFADYQSKPPVVEALDHYGMSTRHCFNFNNSVFCGSSEDNEKELDRAYWRTSHKSWKKCWKVIRDLSPLKTSTMKSIQKELYKTNMRDSALHELEVEVKALLQMYRGPYSKQVEEGRRRVWDMARVAFWNLETTEPGSCPSLWSLIEDTVRQSCGSEQARKVTEFLLVGSPMHLRDAIIAILDSNADLQDQLTDLENRAKHQLAQKGRNQGVVNKFFKSSADLEIDTEAFPPTKLLVIKNTAEALRNLIKDHSNNAMTLRSVVKYLDSLEGQTEPYMRDMIKEVRNHLSG